MKFDEFMRQVKTGRFPIVAGGKSLHILAEGKAYLDPKDLDAVTAEGFNQDVFDDYDWNAAHDLVERELKRSETR